MEEEEEEEECNKLSGNPQKSEWGALKDFINTSGYTFIDSYANEQP